MLLFAALLILVVGGAHSYLGERYILIRLFRGPLPKVLGSEEFTRRTLRFVVTPAPALVASRNPSSLSLSKVATVSVWPHTL